MSQKLPDSHFVTEEGNLVIDYEKLNTEVAEGVRRLENTRAEKKLAKKADLQQRRATVGTKVADLLAT